MVPNGEYYQCKHVTAMTSGQCFKCLEEKEAANPTTSDSEAEQELIATIARFMGVSKHAAAMAPIRRLARDSLAQAEIKARLDERRIMRAEFLKTAHDDRVRNLQAQLKATEGENENN